MPDYVYALHDFYPENVDEISFRAGDRIEVLERDDQYGDGWWQGRNLEGSTGLFPQNYTAPAPPTPSTQSSSPQPDIPISKAASALVPLDEVSETESAPKTPEPRENGDHLHSAEAFDFTPSHHRVDSSGGEMMEATMTDVQQAIEQLTSDPGTAEDEDGARSFSFASTKEDVETDTDYDNNSDMDHGWHNNNRKKLAEKARRAVEEAEKLEAILNDPSALRSTAPPIDVELSDESDAEDNFALDDTFTSKRSHPHIPEEDEDSEAEPNAPSSVGAATASTATTLAPTPLEKPPAPPAPPEPNHDFAGNAVPVPLPDRSVEDTDRSSASLGRSSVSSPARTNGADGTPADLSPLESRRASLPRPSGTPVLNSLDGIVRAVSPNPRVQAPVPVQSQAMQNQALAPQFDQAPQTIPPTTAAGQSASPQQAREKQPSEWSVNEVVEWLRSKGFDQDVQNKFIEQEITGDVLLELDANVLKSEIGIMAFGKRVRIANAITELRQIRSEPSSQIIQPTPLPQSWADVPPQSFSGSPFHSPQYSASSPPHEPHPVLPSTQSHSPLMGQFIPQFPSGAILGAGGAGTAHSRTYSHSQQSQNSYRSSAASAGALGILPGPGQGMMYTQSMSGGLQHSSSLPSTAVPQGSGWGGVPVNGHIVNNGVTGDGSASGSGAVSKAGSMQGVSVSVDEKAALGLLVQDDKDKNEDSVVKSRPGHLSLSLSPSFGALSDTFKAINGDYEDEDQGHMSDTDVEFKKTRRKLFGLSQVSAPSRSGSRHSASSAQSSPKKDTSVDKGHSHARPKKGSDHARTGTERLSIFGATFSGSLGKSRKPPPRYSSGDSERMSMFPIPLFSSSVGRKASGGPNGQLFKEDDKGKEKEKENGSHVLRKRTNSIPSQPSSPRNDKTKQENSPPTPMNGEGLPLRQGQSILEQIGQPDHSGWMRKKGDRYNSWKMRFFVLSGPHLYWLRSHSMGETKIKGYVNTMGYKVTVDETVDPGKYGFRIDHETDKTHYFSSDDKTIIRDWMKAIMKATIARDYSQPVVSSCNIPTIPLTVAQAMNPAPRPPSPSARAATQKAHRTKDMETLETIGVRDINEVPHNATLVLMGLQPRTSSDERTGTGSGFSSAAAGKTKKTDDDDDTPAMTPRAAKPPSAPPRPVREVKRQSLRGISTQLDVMTLEWANSHLPANLRVRSPSEQNYSALALFRLAESIRGYPASPPVPDSVFPSGPSDDRSLEGLFALFDFLVNNEVKMGSVSINDIKMQRPDKVAQIVKALKSWEDRKRMLQGQFVVVHP